jgi:hypothetical protein
MKKNRERERIADGKSCVRLPHSTLRNPIGKGGGLSGPLVHTFTFSSCYHMIDLLLIMLKTYLLKCITPRRDADGKV